MSVILFYILRVIYMVYFVHDLGLCSIYFYLAKNLASYIDLLIFSLLL